MQIEFLVSTLHIPQSHAHSKLLTAGYWGHTTESALIFLVFGGWGHVEYVYFIQNSIYIW